MVPLETFLPQISWRGAGEVRIKMLCGKMSYDFKRPKRAAKIGFQVSLRSGETRRCVPVIVSYCCDTSNGKETSAARYGEGRLHGCFRYHSTYKNTMMGRENARHVMEETVRTRRRVAEL